jgi:hypothetical protein
LRIKEQETRLTLQEHDDDDDDDDDRTDKEFLRFARKIAKTDYYLLSVRLSVCPSVRPHG